MKERDEKNSQLTKIQPQETQLETIYQLVKAKDEKALVLVIESRDCIGIFQGEDNPIIFFAKEGDIESIEFLIDKFKVSLNPAVRGAAHGGHVKLTNNLIERGASLDYAVWGATCGNHVELSNELITRGASLDFAAYGAASGGYVELTNELIGRGAKLDYAVWGAAFGGHVEFTNELIRCGASLHNAVHGAASGGYVDLTNDLISRGANLNNAVQGAAWGGHVALTNDLIVRGASIDHAVNGATSGGYVALINDLILRGASVKHAARGAWNADNNISTQEALCFISFIDNSELRSLLTEKAKKIIETLDAKLLLEQATKLNQLMRERKLSFNQAQGYLKTGVNS